MPDQPRSVRAALDTIDDYCDRVAAIQAVLHHRVTGLLGGGVDRDFLSTFLRFDAQFSAVQDSLAELHATLGAAHPLVSEQEPR